MFEQMPQSPKRKPEPETLPPLRLEDIEDIEDAREYVEEQVAAGVRPIITVPAEYVEDVVRYGITSIPKQDPKTGRRFSFIAGTIGLDPYLPENSTRHVFEVDPAQVRMEPRITGSDHRFHGVVGFTDGVPPSALIPVGEFSMEKWDSQRPNLGTEKGPLH